MDPRPEPGSRGALRRFTLGSGPLKRGSDRLQMTARLVVVFSILAAPPLAVAATTTATARLEATATTQAAERRPGSAVLLEDAPAASRAVGDGAPGAASVPPVQARATWSAPGRPARNGVVLVPPGTPAGTVVPVWVDREGDLTRAPMSPARITSKAAGIGAVLLVGVPLASWALYAALCSALDAHRQRRWARGWAEVEPDWTARLR